MASKDLRSPQVPGAAAAAAARLWVTPELSAARFLANAVLGRLRALGSGALLAMFPFMNQSLRQTSPGIFGFGQGKAWCIRNLIPGCLWGGGGYGELICQGRAEGTKGSVNPRLSQVSRRLCRPRTDVAVAFPRKSQELP